MIAVIAVIAGKKKISDPSDHMETTLQRSQRQKSLNFFFLIDRSDQSDRSDHMETRLKRNTYTTVTDDLSLDRKCM